MHARAHKSIIKIKYKTYMYMCVYVAKKRLLKIKPSQINS